MSQVVKAQVLEFEKSSFLIELKEHHLGDLYLSVTQTIKSTNQTEQTLRINPAYLKKLVNVMKALCPEEEQTQLKVRDKLKKPGAVDAIINTYLKGVDLKSLALLYDVTVSDIEELLRLNDVPIIENKPELEDRRKRSQRRSSRKANFI